MCSPQTFVQQYLIFMHETSQKVYLGDSYLNNIKVNSKQYLVRT